MRIAIVGGGIAGLCAAYHLLRLGHAVTLFDRHSQPYRPGTSASSCAPGILHPYKGRRLLKHPEAEAAYVEAVTFLDAISRQHPSHPALYAASGFFRPVFSEQDKWQRRCGDHSDWHWWDEPQCQEAFPKSNLVAGIFISSGIQVFTPVLLQTLWEVCVGLGMDFISREISYPEDLSDPSIAPTGHDHVIFACGGDSPIMPSTQHLPLHRLKGQVLMIRWPANLPLPHCGIMGETYLVPYHGASQDQRLYFLGATYERGFSFDGPDLDYARSHLLPLAAERYPLLANAEVVEVLAGVRAMRNDHQSPVLEHLGACTWAVTGLGAKGLLYAARLGRLTAEALTATPASAVGT